MIVILGDSMAELKEKPVLENPMCFIYDRDNAWVSIEKESGREIQRFPKSRDPCLPVSMVLKYGFTMVDQIAYDKISMEFDKTGGIPK
jgi:hypothetical protein